MAAGARAIPHDPGSALQKEAIFFLDWLIAVTHNFFTLEGVDPAGVFETGGAERPE